MSLGVNDARRPAARHGAWFRIPRPNPLARWRVICLPHAGGSASFYRPWVQAMPGDVELVIVQYPGREERIEEACIDSMRTMVAGLVRALDGEPQLLNRPYVLFGHSMGAAVAYELCLALQRAPLPPPCQLVVSASEGPGRAAPGELHRSPDRALLDEIVRLNGRLEHLLASPELAALIMPGLRADYRLIETYGATPPSYERIRVPMLALIGREDTELSEADARAWASVAAEGFELQAYPGGHFYLVERFAELAERVLRGPRARQSVPMPDLNLP